MNIKKRNSNKNRNARNNAGLPSERMEIYKQIHEVDFLVVDVAIAVPDTANTGYDLYTQIAGSTDYTNALLAYGEMSWQYFEFRQTPYFEHSTLQTDTAICAFGVRQGIFDTTVAAKTFANVLREPGSFITTNKSWFTFKCDSINKKWISASETNTIVSACPKVNFYYGLNGFASTNTNLSQLHIKIGINFRSKID
jgi:hypothetical protein